MAEPIRILLQTTIPHVEDDWHVGRFSLLKQSLESIAEVTARNREPPGQPDSVLSSLDRSAFDQLWLIAVDTGDGLTPEDCAGVSRFRTRGGGLMVTRDHMDLGSSVCTLGGIGLAHFFHSRNPDPDPSRRANDDPYTTSIQWPNYHSGANGDFQAIEPVGALHALLADVDGTALPYLPSHPHEGAVGPPPDDPSARVIATGRSKVTGRRFNLAVAFEPGEQAGPGLAQSTFHHFADYNWDPRTGCPSFVTEAPGDGMLRDPEGRRSTERYVRNLALWLAGRPTGT